MYILATFFGDSTFSNLIDTDQLQEDIKQEVQKAVTHYAFSAFEGEKYFEALQHATVVDARIFPLEVHGFIDVYQKEQCGYCHLYPLNLPPHE